MKWDYRTDNLLLTEKDRHNQRKACYTPALSTTNTTFTSLGTNPGRCFQRLMPNRSSQDTTVRHCLQFLKCAIIYEW